MGFKNFVKNFPKDKILKGNFPKPDSQIRVFFDFEKVDFFFDQKKFGAPPFFNNLEKKSLTTILKNQTVKKTIFSSI